jgi:glutathione synthase/RimK-type ligase-like ATP-grasp enzyme
LRLLCIANPEAYKGTATDAPLSYAKLAAHDDIDLFHADTRHVLSEDERILAARIRPGFAPEDFQSLKGLSSDWFEPEQFDLVFCRTLKPFPGGYLDRLAKRSERLLFVNNPAGIQRQLEPDFFRDAAAGVCPDMVVTADAEVAKQFQATNGRIVVKRGNSCGGRGVYRVTPTGSDGFRIDNIVEGASPESDFGNWFSDLTLGGAQKAVLMRYLPRVVEGDRRIVAIGGEIYGSYLRTSATGQWVQNVSAGARCSLAEALPGDEAIVSSTSPYYSEAGIHFLGYDLLQDDDGVWRVSEINAGNVGGIFRLEELGITGVTDRFVGWLHQFVDSQRKSVGE